MQRNTHTLQPHTSGNYLTYTHNGVNGLSTTKSSCPWFWHGNTESLTHYTRGRDLVMEQMRSPKAPVEGFQEVWLCVYEGRADLNLRWTLRKQSLPRSILFNQRSLWISFESELLLSSSSTLPREVFYFSINSEIQFRLTHSNQSSELKTNLILFWGIKIRANTTRIGASIHPSIFCHVSGTRSGWQQADARYSRRLSQHFPDPPGKSGGVFKLDEIFSLSRVFWIHREVFSLLDMPGKSPRGSALETSWCPNHLNWLFSTRRSQF